MKVLLITPSPSSLHRGPATTVLRYRQGLQRRGHLCELLGGASEGGLRESLEGAIDRFRPDLVHAHDALHSGVSVLGLRIPWVVSVTGEDVYRSIEDPEHGVLICETLRQARRVLVPTDACAAHVERYVPDTVGRIDVVARAAEPLATGGTDLRRSLGIPRNRMLVLVPGGLRPVKGQDRAVGLLRALRDNGADAELVIIGAEQDPDYAATLRAATAGDPRIRLLPPLSRERMGAAYMNADVVLNTSLHEGMSLSILEAGILGRPVVASDIDGNRALVRHKETGLLFDDDASLARAVLAVWRNRAAAGALGVRMREDFKRRFGTEREIDRLLGAYAAA